MEETLTKLFLPNVTLMMIETMEHRLARLVVEDCLQKVKFGGVFIFTDKPEQFKGIEADFILVENWPTKKDWCHYFWSKAPMHVATSHFLAAQWDSGIWDVEMWNSQFLAFDYIGSPWWYAHKNVGNGGFSIRSTRLARYVATHQTDFPCDTTVDDDLLCRQYRPKLEARGFVWSPENLARDFAFECVRPDPDSRHFGFHAAFNFPAVLDREQLLERVKLMKNSPYVSKSYIWSNFCKAYPDLA